MLHKPANVDYTSSGFSDLLLLCVCMHMRCVCVHVCVWCAYLCICGVFACVHECIWVCIPVHLWRQEKLSGVLVLGSALVL